MRSLILAVATSVFVVGCSTLTYQDPTSGPRARVRFVTDSNEVSVLRTYGDENCSTGEVEWLRLRNGFLLNSSPKRLGIPLWNYHDNAAKELYVEANKTITGLFQGGETTGMKIYRCGTPFTFLFQENFEYEVFFKWARAECRVTISQLVSSQQGIEKKEIAEFSNQTTDINRGCMARFHTPRLY